MIIQKKCICGKAFLTHDYRIKDGRGKFCSKKCQYKNATRPSGLNYNIKVENNGWFKKGFTPWCKGLAGKGICKANKGSIKKGQRRGKNTEFKKGFIPWNKEKEFYAIRGEKHPNWKGDNISYGGLHCWINKHWVKKSNCDFCGEDKKIDWANKNGIYNRNKNNYLNLCRKCHLKFDKMNPKRKLVV